MTQSIPPQCVHGFTRRDFIFALTAGFGYCGAVAAGMRPDSPSAHFRIDVDEVVPRRGVRTQVIFGDSIRKLIVAGALDPDKYRAVNASSRGLPAWVERLFVAPSTEPILLSAETVPYLLQLLWPLGLSTRAGFNENSPINTIRLPSFASTAGWTLGREPNGYVYFNRVDTVRLSRSQEAKVLEAATRTFRPCCDNSTLFQDCNHGSALLGLMELAAAQGASANELYRIAQAANAYWFPSQYAMMAMYFTYFRHQAWNTASPQQVLGAEYSSFSGWQRNVAAALAQANPSRPVTSAAPASCGTRRQAG